MLDGHGIPNCEFAPTMYILAGPLPGTSGNQPVSLPSLVFSGANGVTAIVTTNSGTPAANTFALYSIP